MIYKVDPNINIVHSASLFPDKMEKVDIAELQGFSLEHGRINIQKTDPNYPDRSDIKIMRNDVIASIVAIRRLLSKLDISPEEKDNIALYVANSVFFEGNNKNINRAFRALNKMVDLDNEKERIMEIYKSTPPLIALETLTNSTMSFIAQYTGIKGSNTTFGSTSHAAFHTLEAGIDSIGKNDCKNALVGGSNCSGIFSFFTFQHFHEQKKGWKESEASAFLLLGKEGPVRISQMGSVPKKISFSGNKDRSWSSFFGKEKTEMILYSGGFTTREFKDNEEEVCKFGNRYMSLEKQYGNMGSSAIFLHLIKANEMIIQGKCQTAVVLNRDAYGRESFIKLEKA